MADIKISKDMSEQEKQQLMNDDDIFRPRSRGGCLMVMSVCLITLGGTVATVFKACQNKTEPVKVSDQSALSQVVPVGRTR